MNEYESKCVCLEQEKNRLLIIAYEDLTTADQIRFLVEENLIIEGIDCRGNGYKKINTDKLSVNQINMMFQLGIACIAYEAYIEETTINHI